MTAASKTQHSQSEKSKKDNARHGQGVLTGLALIIALLACVGVGYLFWHARVEKKQLQLSLQAASQQVSLLQNQDAQTQTAMQSNMQIALQKDQQNIAKALSQLTVGQAQANRQIALSSVIYLVRMANLALIINQDPKVATHFLNMAQERLKGMPELVSLRAEITDKKAQLAALPDLDVDGLLLQLGSLKKVVMSLDNIPHWSKQIHPDALQKNSQQNLENKASADIGTFWSWLKRFIIVSHQDNDPNILPTPEHFQSVQDSVYLGISTAQWAILHKNTQVYQHALQAVVMQLQSIKQSDSKAISQLITELNALAKHSISPSYPNLDGLMGEVVDLQNKATSSNQEKTMMTTDAVSAPSTQAQIQSSKDQNNKSANVVKNDHASSVATKEVIA